jgi:hypothetical protein
MAIAMKKGGLIADYVLGKAPRTQEQYICCLTKFLTYLYPDKTDLDLEKQTSLFLKQARKKEWAQQKLVQYIQTLKDRKDKDRIEASTVRSYFKAIKLLCELHDISINFKRIARNLGRSRKVANDRIPMTHEIKKLIEFPDRRIKPLVLVMLSSGMRVDALGLLQVKHVIPLDRDGQTLSLMEKEKEKEKVAAAKLVVYANEPEQYFTFITPEAYFALKEWLDYRKQNGENITGESWLMRDIWAFKYNLGAGNPQRLSTFGVKKLVNRALWEQGLRHPLNGGRRHEWKANHGFRKFYKTRAEQAGMGPVNVETLMAHSTGMSDHYYRPTEHDLLKDYLKAVDNLTIDNTRQMVIKEVSENQQALAAQMESKDKEIQELRDKMARMEESQLKITELLEVLKIAKSRDGRIGGKKEDRTILDEKRRVTIGYVDNNNQNVEMKIPIDGFEIDELTSSQS